MSRGHARYCFLVWKTGRVIAIQDTVHTKPRGCRLRIEQLAWVRLESYESPRIGQYFHRRAPRFFDTRERGAESIVASAKRKAGRK